MGASTIEKGVLKLVHPGRHVEYHRRSITAAEIMRKNPRHSITRPDFFKNPDVVVRPESVMVPGQVFYIVPNKTVHRLMKNKSQQLDQPSPQQTESPNTGEDYKEDPSTQTSPCKLWAGTTPMYDFQHEHVGSSSCGCTDSPSQVEETTQRSLVDDMPDDSLTLTFLLARNYYLNRNRSPEWSMPTDNGQQLQRSDEQVKNLKSCLKKEGCVRTLPNLRVTFDVTTMIEY